LKTFLGSSKVFNLLLSLIEKGSCQRHFCIFLAGGESVSVLNVTTACDSNIYPKSANKSSSSFTEGIELSWLVISVILENFTIVCGRYSIYNCVWIASCTERFVVTVKSEILS
jgi:hypothetical protein